MTEIRALPAVEKRVETGPVQFGDDWPGVFIRGDDAFGLVMQLKQPITREWTMDHLLRLLDSAHLRPEKPNA